jgi:hypothetical protein
LLYRLLYRSPHSGVPPAREHLLLRNLATPWGIAQSRPMKQATADHGLRTLFTQPAVCGEHKLVPLGESLTYLPGDV